MHRSSLPTFALSSLLVASLSLASRPAAAEEPSSTPADDGYHDEERPQMTLVRDGFGTFAGTYLLTAFFGGYLAGEPWFYAPVVGPLGYTVQYYNHNECDSGCRYAYALAAVGSGAQAVGLAVGFYGLMTTETVRVRDDKPGVAIMPTVGPGHAGLAAVGRF